MTAVRIRYQTIEFDEFDIHLRSLKDKQQFNDPFSEAENLGISSAQWSLFGVLWQSSQVLADKMQHFEISGKRILEVGCGLGLSSLLLSLRDADITATDYHPEAGKFLVENIKLNQCKEIPFLRTNWKDEQPQLGSFDLIIGSDLLYEQNHINMLSDFIERHTKPGAEVILVDPGRGKHAKFSKAMMENGFEHSQYKPNNTQLRSDKMPFKGLILKYKRSI
ncbi:class I SAM-dependent methyltransferase [Thiomicrorhabdus heinhorstiae]|uniref:Methyltransferase domain-containing protein n=1 Tax=Thiomicrorhabdus heinhorstiae TaxID=2748010 RepID=A0ABS0BUG3_9GAMM|nr:methyltransferase domain-containing protein [Thiomicrorhabdus heinhorstiae]MBF6057415.1 methyltransferase domain-containing protein [Thiomicrorhabdus heinhorstiae]